MTEVRQIIPIENWEEQWAYGQNIFGGAAFAVGFSDLLNQYASPNYIAFDGLGIDLDDDSKKFYESGDYSGWMSLYTSDATRRFPALFGVAFYWERIYPEGITLSFYGDCCRELEVRYFEDGAQVGETETVAVEDENPFVALHPPTTVEDGEQVLNAHRVEISFTMSTIPNQAIKLKGLHFGRVAVFDRLKSVELLEEINILSDDLPINTLTYSVVSEQPIEFRKNAPVNLYSNGAYYGTYYLQDIEQTSKELYTVKASNCIQKLNDTELVHWASLNTSLETFTEQFGVEVRTAAELEGKDFYCFGHLPVKSRRYALAAYAFACCLMVDSARQSGAVILQPIPTGVTSVIRGADERIIGESKYKRNEQAAKAIYTYPIGYSETAEEITLQNTAYDFGEFRYEKPPFEFDWEDVASYIVTRGEKSLNAVSFGAYTSGITLSGKRYEFTKRTEYITNDKAESSKELKYEDFNLRGAMYWVEDKDGESVRHSVILTEQKKGDILKYMRSGGTVTAKIILRGEKPGDLIQIETAYAGMVTGIITSMTVHFGYETTADIEVTEWEAEQT